MKPKSLDNLIVSLTTLPGITRKQAERLAYRIILDKKEETSIFFNNWKKATELIHYCEECGHLTEKKKCYICIDSEKNRRNVLIIVESPLDVFKFENSKSIKPFYHVLHGLIKTTNEVRENNLNVKNLIERVKKFDEIILALSPNIEGIVTANYIKSIIDHKKIMQLAQGIPLGATMEYIDELTLKIAVDNRKDIK